MSMVRAVGAVFVLLSAGCASLPSDYPPPPQTLALEPDAATTIGRLAAELASTHGPGVSGYEPIDANGEALRIRLAMIDSAERSIDMLYYVWYADPGGLLVLEHVIAAAENGVRVRVVVDDTLFVKGKEGLGNLDAHPNIEIRVFNPWASSGVARAFETAARAKRLNTRMHNKLLIADSQMAILGGRNIGDHYFGLHHKYNFHDLDLVVAGAEAFEASEIFDHFWTSDQVMPVRAFVEQPSWQAIESLRSRELVHLRDADEVSEFPVERRDWRDELAALVERMSVGSSTVEYDRLIPGSGEHTGDAVVRVAQLVEQARSEVLILNAYVIPHGRMMEILRAAHERGVRVRMLTNSLASNDVPAVTSKYAKHRKPLLEAGVELYEFRADPEIQPGIVDTRPVTARFAGFHTKATVIDREHVFIGSLNLDPRSIQLNTEMGMIVTSRGLAEEVAAIAERDMSPSNSWHVELDENGKLTWESTAGRVTRQPAISGWQRVQAWFFKILPEGQL